ncbi:unnamed protein product [Prorocentrum cordatum]|uniref:Uncharacterized protein n=1 Tax=Prorocentrum cordatum TaxID=2364126 RepID=A0ABN9T0U7_9DINO|nr:unnamed protein product [Polarella glacialis]
MWEAKLEPDVILSCSAGISACEKGEHPSQLQCWDQRVREGREVAAGAGTAERDAGGEGRARPLVSYSAGVSACEKGDQWQPALALLSEMREEKLEPNVIHPMLQRWDQRVREGLSVAAGAGAAERDPGGETGAPPPVSYNAGISACEKREQWQRSLALLSEMCEAKLEPDIISYTAGISACEKGGHQLQRWDQRVREGLSVAAGAGAAERDV